MSQARGMVEAFLSSTEGAALPLPHAAFLISVADAIVDTDPARIYSRIQWVLSVLASHDGGTGIPATSAMPTMPH
jgi:hypothetical protein